MRLSAETKLELAIVQAYVAEEQARRAEMFHWIAEELEEAFAELDEKAKAA
jgi:hypothetical protein